MVGTLPEEAKESVLLALREEKAALEVQVDRAGLVVQKVREVHKEIQRDELVAEGHVAV